MPKVYCAEIECEYYSEKGCKAKEINVSAGRIHTIHQGFARHWVCRTFKMSKEAEEISELLKPYFDKIKKEKNDNA